MPRPKSDKKSQSINFDLEVLNSLQFRCKREGVLMSTFVNNLVRKVVMGEYEFYRQLSKSAASELHKFKTLMDTAIDKPREVLE